MTQKQYQSSRDLKKTEKNIKNCKTQEKITGQSSIIKYSKYVQNTIKHEFNKLKVKTSHCL